jgi:hypothetical protein
MRRMTVRAKEPPRRVIHVPLEPGTLFVMSYSTQLHYTHAVPTAPDAVGERISLAFRVKPSKTSLTQGEASRFPTCRRVTSYPRRDCTAA